MSTPAWRKSSKCANGTCVEIATTDQGALVRDNKRADSPILAFDCAAWAAFVTGVRNGDFDLS